MVVGVVRGHRQMETPRQIDWHQVADWQAGSAKTTTLPPFWLQPACGPAHTAPHLGVGAGQADDGLQGTHGHGQRLDLLAVAQVGVVLCGGWGVGGGGWGGHVRVQR